jgi:hypothetical protein
MLLVAQNYPKYVVCMIKISIEMRSAFVVLLMLVASTQCYPYGAGSCDYPDSDMGTMGQAGTGNFQIQVSTSNVQILIF